MRKNDSFSHGKMTRAFVIYLSIENLDWVSLDIPSKSRGTTREAIWFIMKSVNLYLSPGHISWSWSRRRACADATPIIDGQRANCNLASLGAQHRGASHPPFSSVRGEKIKGFSLGSIYVIYLRYLSASSGWVGFRILHAFKLHLLLPLFFQETNDIIATIP